MNIEVVENGSPPALNKYHKGRNTGWIEIEIEALTPIYICGTLTKTEIMEKLDSKDKPGFFAPLEKIRIPGSSLRGMTRNMVEIMGFGKFGYFDNKRLYFRGLADKSNLRKEYQDKMASYDQKQKKSTYGVSAGVIRKKGFDYFIIPSNYRQIAKAEAEEKVKRLGKEYDQFNFYTLDNEFLVVSGNMQNKKKDWLIYFPTDDSKKFMIPTEDVEQYKNDSNRSDKVPNLISLAAKGDVPCFYVFWKDGKDQNRISFGHTGMFRLAYMNTIAEHIPIPTIFDEGSSIDFAEAIFGNEKTHAGRIFFEDAFLKEEENSPQLDKQVPKILSTPKPTTFQHYLVQESDKSGRLSHYNCDTSIRGYKLYWHRSGAAWIETDRDFIEKHPKQYLMNGISPVRQGTRFRGRIRFENLSDEELGAILFALDLPPGCGHKIGMGKPLGLGSIRITPTLYLSNRQARYRDFFSEWGNQLPESGKLQEKKQKFESFILRRIGEDDEKLLWDTDRMKELLIMLRFDVGMELEKSGKTRYMKIAPQNEFKFRNVLPIPTSLLPPSKVDSILMELKDRQLMENEFRLRDDGTLTLMSDFRMMELKDQAVIKKARMTHIREINIEGLWETFDIAWRLDPDVNILIGINGSGKTTILEIIRYALQNEFEKEVKYEPLETKIVFDNGESIHFKGKDKLENPSNSLKMEFISTFDVVSSSSSESDREKLSRIRERQLDDDLEKRFIQLQPMLGSLPENITINPFIDEFLDIVNIVFEKTEKNMEFVGSFECDVPFFDRLSREENISEDIYESVNSILKREKIGNKHWFPDQEFLAFLEVALGKHNAKRYRSRILKNARFEGCPSHPIFRLPDSRVLMPDQLSAGEKQILIILLTVLILKIRSLMGEEKHCILILDEPEISLHLEWQKSLIDYILRLNKDIQIIIATHSPGILMKGWLDKATEMHNIRRKRA